MMRLTKWLPFALIVVGIPSTQLVFLIALIFGLGPGLSLHVGVALVSGVVAAGTVTASIAVAPRHDRWVYIAALTGVCGAWFGLYCGVPWLQRLGGSLEAVWLLSAVLSGIAITLFHLHAGRAQPSVQADAAAPRGST